MERTRDDFEPDVHEEPPFGGDPVRPGGTRQRGLTLWLAASLFLFAVAFLFYALADGR